MRASNDQISDQEDGRFKMLENAEFDGQIQGNVMNISNRTGEKLQKLRDSVEEH